MGQAMDIWDILGMLASFAFFAGLSAFTWLAYSRTFELNQRVMNTFAPGASAALMEHAVDRGAVERHLAPVAARHGLTRRGLGWFGGDVDGRAWSLGVGHAGQREPSLAHSRGHALLFRVDFRRPLGLGLTVGRSCPELDGWMAEHDIAWLTRTLRQAGGKGCVTDAAVEVTVDQLFTSHEACHHMLGWTAQLAEKLEARADALPPNRARAPASGPVATTIPSHHAGRAVSLDLADAADDARAYLRMSVGRPLALRFALHSTARGGVAVHYGLLYGRAVARAWEVCPQAPMFFAGAAYDGRFIVTGAPSEGAHALLSHPEVGAAIAALDPMVTDVLFDGAALHLALARAPGSAEAQGLLVQQARVVAALERAPRDQR